MLTEGSTTRILIVDSDETSFAIRQCIAQALKELPPVELFHARDATEALALLESIAPDVIVLDDNEPEECELLIDSLALNHPPIIFCTEHDRSSLNEPSLESQITYLPKNETLEGVHQTLMLAAAVGLKSIASKENGLVH